MYPLNVKTPGPVLGFAVANNEAEHAALTARGYLPAFEGQPAAEESPNTQGHTVESVRHTLDQEGIAYDRRLGLAKLIALLP